MDDRDAWLSPMSAMYRQLPPGHGATAISSQFTISAPVTWTEPITAPLSDSAHTIGFFESLCVQTTPGVRPLNATPLASGTFCICTTEPSMAQAACVRLVRAESALAVLFEESGAFELLSPDGLQNAV